MTAIVFLGPTLAPAEAAKLVPAVYLPPAGQGDLYRAVRAHRPVAVGLIDGRFLDTAAVWHREILWAMSQGVHVFGAASMGALRAAELASYGMRGVGQVFEAYRDGRWPGDADAFEDDDEVAVIHAPPEIGGAALSDAMVDLRATLAAAEAAGLVAPADRRRLIEASKRRPFAERSFAALRQDAEAALGPGHALSSWLVRNKVPRKRLDAIAMLEAVAVLLAENPASFVADFVMQQPMFWQRFVAACDGSENNALSPSEELVLARLRRDPKAWRRYVRETLGRLPGGLSARPAGDPARGMRRELGRLRQERGLWHREALLAWMTDNALEEADLERLLQREDELERLAEADPSPDLLRAMLDHLRISGAFAVLLRDATDRTR